MFITKKHLPRRTFLRGAGCAIALPLLDAMIPGAHRARRRPLRRRLPRLGFVYFPHGAIMETVDAGGGRQGVRDHADSGAAQGLQEAA